MNRQWVVEPRHGFFAKDGRGWYAGAGNLGNSLPWLLPTTLRGALCTAVGRELERQRPNLLTPQEWLELKSELRLRSVIATRTPVGSNFTTADRMWPAPADAIHLAGQPAPVRLVARAAEAQWWDAADDPSLQCLDWLTIDPAAGHSNAKPERGPAWWTEAEFLGWLQDAVGAGPSAEVSPHRQTQSRTDIHVKMDAASGTAESGLLWAHQFRETLTVAEASTAGRGMPETHFTGSICRWGFGVDVEVTEERAAQVSPTTATLAGDRHLASLWEASDLTVFPQAYRQVLAGLHIGKRLRLYATTPTVFDEGWCPVGFRLENNRLVGKLPVIDVPVKLVAAAVGRPVPVSGWDLVADSDASSHSDGRQHQAGGAPRPTQLACPPGSMWLVERLDGQSFSAADVESFWLASWGRGTDDGLGGFVAGVDLDV